MIILNKKKRNIIKQCKTILNNTKNLQEIYNKLDNNFERITNQPKKEYSKTYILAEILKSKTLKEFKKEFYYNSTRFLGGVILEVVAYKQAPQGITILYNEFNQLGEQVKLEIFKEKEK